MIPTDELSPYEQQYEPAGDIESLVRQNRSVRRFYEDDHLSMETLTWLIDLARITPSAGNLQSLRYILSNEKDKNERIFNTLAWAAYLKDWPGPPIGERPAAYVIIAGDTLISKNFYCDHGIAAQTIMLAAREKGYGGCIIASIKKEKLREALSIPDRYDILLALALGKPKESVVIEEVSDGESIRYWRDANMVHHVPKRRLDDIILKV